ncbi:MAG: GNAT family N-acetyltransferase [Chloroflexi bacterium]|nr:GNAT family N-acetyltransferase [Chloroflexota bacterium]
MSERPVFRKATRRDAADIAAIGQAVISERGAAASGLPEAMTAEAVEARLAGYGDEGAMFICRVGGEPAAFAALEPDPREAGCFVMGVWVLAAYRRRGIGRELALMAMEHARAQGCEKLRGTLPAGNEAALSFFSEMGALAQAAAGGMQYELPL